jgi:hypothetical protein
MVVVVVVSLRDKPGTKPPTSLSPQDMRIGHYDAITGINHSTGAPGRFTVNEHGCVHGVGDSLLQFSTPQLPISKGSNGCRCCRGVAANPRCDSGKNTAPRKDKRQVHHQAVAPLQRREYQPQKQLLSRTAVGCLAIIQNHP